MSVHIEIDHAFLRFVACSTEDSEILGQKNLEVVIVSDLTNVSGLFLAMNLRDLKPRHLYTYRRRSWIRIDGARPTKTVWTQSKPRLTMCTARTSEELRDLLRRRARNPL